MACDISQCSAFFAELIYTPIRSFLVEWTRQEVILSLPQRGVRYEGGQRGVRINIFPTMACDISKCSAFFAEMMYTHIRSFLVECTSQEVIPFLPQ
jgi:hypothetical protein